MSGLDRIARGNLHFQGRGALAATLKAVGLRAGDRVALQAFTCVAVPEGILGAGAVPVYVDIESGGVNMSPRALEETLKRGDVSGVVLQHTFGIPADPTLFEIAQRYGAKVIEDCCHTLTSSVEGVVVGDRGDAAFTSFEWGKPIVGGLGGAAWSAKGDVDDSIERGSRALSAPPPITQLKIFIQYVAYRLLYRPSVYWLIRDIQRRATKLGLSVGNFGSGSADRWTPRVDALGWSMWRAGPWLVRRASRRLHARNASAKRWVAAYAQAIAGAQASLVEKSIGEGAHLVRFPVILRGDKESVLARARNAKVEMAGWYETPVHPLDESQLGEAGYVLGSCPEAERRCKELVSLSVVGRFDQTRIDRLVSVIGR